MRDRHMVQDIIEKLKEVQMRTRKLKTEGIDEALEYGARGNA